MRKTTKGAVAAAGAAVLLLGGAGSLAYWSDAATVDGGSVNSGKLTITDTTAGTCAAAGWAFDDAEGTGAFDPATDALVPGDVVTKTCTYRIGAVGKHLRADLTATGGTASGTLASALSTSGTFTVGGANRTSITSADDGSTVTAKIKVTFDPASGNSTQQQTANLSSFVITLQQVHG